MQKESIVLFTGMVTVLWYLALPLRADDWPMAGRDRTRNAVSPEKGGPTDWDVRTGRNVKWKAHVGDFSACEPVVSGGLVWIGTNNSEPRDSAVKSPAGILACFREQDGAFVYQHECVLNNGAPLVRRAMFGQTGSPMIEGDGLWFVTVGAQALCLDLTPLRHGRSSMEMRWQVDFLSDLDVSPFVDVMGRFTPAKGLLIIGIAGTGKSLSAKVAARVFDVPLLKLDAGRLYGGLVGQSEANLRSVIQTAEAIAPCCL
jgi:hypothetical protein